MADSVLNLIRQIIVERLFLDIDPQDLEPLASLTAVHGVDSVRLFDMIVGLEEVFGVTFEDDELTIENFDTIRNIAQRIEEKRPNA